MSHLVRSRGKDTVQRAHCALRRTTSMALQTRDHSASGLCIQTAQHSLSQTQQIFTWPCPKWKDGNGFMHDAREPEASSRLCRLERCLGASYLFLWLTTPGFTHSFEPLENCWKLLQLDSTLPSLDMFAQIRCVLTFRELSADRQIRRVYAMIRNVSRWCNSGF